MSDRTAEQLRDEATAAAMEVAESKRETDRLRAILAEKVGELVQATIERDEARREAAQSLASERAVRRLVLAAQHRGEAFVSIADVRAALDTEVTS